MRFPLGEAVVFLLVIFIWVLMVMNEKLGNLGVKMMIGSVRYYVGKNVRV